MTSMTSGTNPSEGDLLKKKELLLKVGNEDPLGVAIVELGKNNDLRLSQDEKKLLYSSSDRRAHLQYQIYSLDLSNFRERRLTFNDGESRYPILLENKDLIYSSNTDALKEKPLLFYPNQGFRVSHLYLSDTAGNEVRRLSSEFSQMLATGDFLPNNQILISKKVPKNSSDGQVTALIEELFQLNPKNQDLQKIGNSDGALIHYSLAEKAWLKLSSQEDSSQVLSSNDPSFKKVNFKVDIPISNISEFSLFKDNSDSHLKILTSGLLKISSDPNNPTTTPQNFGIFLIDIESKCIRQILKTPQPVTQPQLTKDGKSLFYVSSERQNLGIYMKLLNLATVPCINF